MPVEWSQDSAYAKEMVKHEANYSKLGPPGRPYVYRSYPTMMYRAGRNANGASIVILDGPAGRMEATSDAERANLEAQGYVWGGAAEAVKAYERQQFEHAELAAIRNYEDKNMSDKAKAESHAVEVSTSEHVPAIPETPIRRLVKKGD